MFFEFRPETEALSESFAKLLVRQIGQKVGERIPRENRQTYSHGRSWQHPANEKAFVGELKTQSAEYSTHFSEIADGDFGVITRMIASVVKQFDEAAAKMLYSTVAEICDATGQTVDAKGKSFPDAFLEAFRKLEFVVGRDGTVSLPEIHVGNMDMVKQLESMGEEYHREFERLKEEKVAHAKAQEAIRKAKFRRRN